MKLYKFAIAIITILSCNVQATDYNSIYLIMDVNKLSTPIDSITDYGMLGGDWNRILPADVCQASGTSRWRNVAITVLTGAPSTTMVMDGRTYGVFTYPQLHGVGIIAEFRFPDGETVPLVRQSNMSVYSLSSPASSIEGAFYLGMVKLPGSTAASGTAYNVPFVKTLCTNPSTDSFQYNVTVRNFDIPNIATSCKYEASKNIQIPLGNHIISELPTVGNTFGNVDETVTLICDSGITPYMTVTDTSDPGNRTNIIKLTSDSTAKGVGVQFFYDGVARALGPDSSAKGTVNQFLIGKKTTTNDQQITIPLSFKYVRTDETVTPGSANANATITFSYQ